MTMNEIIKDYQPKEVTEVRHPKFQGEMNSKKLDEYIQGLVFSMNCGNREINIENGVK